MDNITEIIAFVDNIDVKTIKCYKNTYADSKVYTFGFRQASNGNKFIDDIHIHIHEESLYLQISNQSHSGKITLTEAALCRIKATLLAKLEEYITYWNNNILEILKAPML